MKYEHIPTCLAPFTGMFVNVERITPCCIFNSGCSDSKDPLDAWNSETFRNFRKVHYQRDITKLPRECKECIHNSFSLRDAFYQKFSDTIPLINKLYNEETGELPIETLKELSVGPSNLCNLACITCCKQQSHTYHRIFDEAVNDNTFIDNILIFKSNGVVEEKFHLMENFEAINNNLSHMVLHGGEPTMSMEIYDILKIMEKKNKDVDIFYLANATMYKFPNGENVFDVLEPFNNLTVVMSLDGMGDRLSYIRHLQTEKRFLKYIKTANERLPKAIFKIHFTMSNLSILHMIDTVNQIDKLIDKGEIKVDHFSFNTVNYPKIYRPANLPDELKQKAIKEIQEFVNNHRDNWPNYLILNDFSKMYKTLYNYNFDKQLWSEFLMRQKDMDDKRGFIMSDYFPELKDYVI